ncbi:hypothetical protein BDY17DRAFT_49812 [Neohortaea acidophila]|uniref:Uncharacterized protein n=1 Tax=Neohortaea acidophila TaxID=245834 RepID=A0A6A6PHP5_9PEZI|nr:uncharacterized protein BDY17DRAFT_49812 [Neohortaea acidophila]KAF2479113.1 hypothetical protein BDY17DRAFT_49812 [Neohortaea acidophila]
MMSLFGFRWTRDQMPGLVESQSCHHPLNICTSSPDSVKPRWLPAGRFAASHVFAQDAAQRKKTQTLSNVSAIDRTCSFLGLRFSRTAQRGLDESSVAASCAWTTFRAARMDFWSWASFGLACGCGRCAGDIVPDVSCCCSDVIKRPAFVELARLANSQRSMSRVVVKISKGLMYQSRFWVSPARHREKLPNSSSTLKTTFKHCN